MKRKRNLFLAAMLLCVGGAIVPWLLWPYRDAITRENVRAAVEWVATLGPWVFFGALAVLPLFWIPVSPFLLIAPVFGTPLAIGGSLLALAANMSVAWLVSGKWFRPFFERVVARYGYEIPVLSGGNMYWAALLLRLTPGVPFALQNYLLGLARMPYLPFMALSVPAMALPTVAFILLGEAVLEGSLGMILAALFVVLLVTVALRYARLRLKRKALEREISGTA